MAEVKVTIQPENLSISVPQGTTLKDALSLAGKFIDYPCGGQTRCGKCKVQIKHGLTDPSPAEVKLLSLHELKWGIRLACQAKVTQDTVIFILKKSQIDRKKLLSTTLFKKYPLNPYCKKPHPNYGLALDIGTTSIVGVLIDLTTGKELTIYSELNSQSVYGVDIISRIKHAIENKNGQKELQQKVVEVINKIILKLLEETSIKNTDITDVTVVGNTVMQHLLIGLSVKKIATLPFEPATKESINIKAKNLRIAINSEANVYVFPNISGFVGGDTVGVILALDLHNSKEINLAIDIGTNGEIVLGSEKQLLCASTAAGPAFEGANITCGMRATEGAIESVYITNEGVLWQTIGHTKAEGICGSGLIDTIAELLKLGIINETGRLKNKTEIRKLSSVLKSSLREINGQPSFLITENKYNIFVTQEDIRKLQLAKGAIYSGIQILKMELGLNNNDISQLYIAGTFGNYIDKKNGQIIGLIPEPLEKVTFVGNSALEGAKLALISQEARKEVEKIVKKLKHIELSARTDFQTEFAQSMSFKSVL